MKRPRRYKVTKLDLDELGRVIEKGGYITLNDIVYDLFEECTGTSWTVHKKNPKLNREIKKFFRDINKALIKFDKPYEELMREVKKAIRKENDGRLRGEFYPGEFKD